MQKKLSQSIYKETTHYDEDDNMISKTVSSPGLEHRTHTLGYMQVQPQDNFSLNNYPTTVTTTTTNLNSTGEPYSVSVPYNGGLSIGGVTDTYPYNQPLTYPQTNPYYFPIYNPTSSAEDTKVTKRSEQMKISRLNTLKEFLDQFNECKDFNDVYKVIDKMKDAFDLLDNELA